MPSCSRGVAGGSETLTRVAGSWTLVGDRGGRLARGLYCFPLSDARRGTIRYSTTNQELRTTMKNALIINETTKRILFLTLLSFLALC